MISIDDRAGSGRKMRIAAALCGFFAVALGAFGTHALRSTLVELTTAEVWSTASLYHLTHSAVLLCIAHARPAARLSFLLFLGGIVLFCGSLYIFSVTGSRPVAMAAPVGGSFLLAGWLALAFGSRRDSETSGSK